MCTMWNVCDLRKKLVAIHDSDCDTFETDSVLVLIEHIWNLVTSGVDGTQNYELPDTSEIRSSLHEISSFKCRCSGGDAAMEILQLLSRYEWEAKIAIVLASFVVDYAQFGHAIKLYTSNRLGELVAVLKQIPGDIDDSFNQMRSSFSPIIDQSIKVTKLIAQFSIFPSKYISDDVEPLANALDHIPVAVYWMTEAVSACSSQLREVLASEIDYSSPGVWHDQSLERITRSRTYLNEKLKLCHRHIAEKKLTKCMEKLDLKFNQATVGADNRKTLELIINTKDPNHSHPLESSLDKGAKVGGLEALRGKTVLLFFSELDIPYHEILMLNRFYQESRLTSEQQYEIVWLPTEENIEKNEILKQKFEAWKSVMKWYCLQRPGLLKPGVVKYVKEELQYSKKNPRILVAVDPRGKMVNPNAFDMVWKWGNAAYPFTKRRELDLCSRMEWSLQLLVDGIDQGLSNWIKEDKIICLYGGKDKEWIEKFVTRARQVEDDADDIEMEMMYVGKETGKEVTEALERGRSRSLAPECSWYLLKRIESMMVCPAPNKKLDTSFVAEMDNMHRLGHHKSWALFSQGAGLGADAIARGSGDEMLQGLNEFMSWKDKGHFVMALKQHVAGRQLIPSPDFCTLCHRSMYSCYTD